MNKKHTVVVISFYVVAQDTPKSLKYCWALEANFPKETHSAKLVLRW